jgi:hypothetical protein
MTKSWSSRISKLHGLHPIPLSQEIRFGIPPKISDLLDLRKVKKRYLGMIRAHCRNL